MNITEWLTEQTGKTLPEIAKDTGISRRTLYHQVERGKVTVENLTTIARTYNISVVQALLAANILVANDLNLPKVELALRRATDEQLTGEILRRLRNGSQAYDNTVDEAIDTSSNVVEFQSGERDTPQKYAAKSGTPEPEEGDDDYGDGA